jgi:hypothetical protein
MPLPRVQPIIPSSRKEPFDHPDWLFELKYDGFRALLYLEKGSGHSLTRFDALAQAVAAELEVTEAIFGGEVIAADETGRPQFYDLVRCTRRPSYVTFDLLWLNGADLRSPHRTPQAPAEHPAEEIPSDLRGARGTPRPMPALAWIVPYFSAERRFPLFSP